MTHKTFYIAGPMRGYDHFNFPMFDRCAADLREWFTVISPAEHDREIGFDETANSLDGFDLPTSMLWDLEQIALNADGIVLLPGWEASAGVAAELALARALGRIVYTYDPDYRDSDDRHLLNPLPSAVTPSTAHDWIQESVSDDRMVIVNRNNPTDRRIIEDASDLPYEVRVTDPETGGQKGAKLARFSLIPAGALSQLAEHYGRGAQKYEDDNWRRGYSWRLSFDALNRHLWAFWNGEDIDGETGSPHLVAVAWHAFTLLTFASEGLGTDDRQAVQK